MRKSSFLLFILALFTITSCKVKVTTPTPVANTPRTSGTTPEVIDPDAFSSSVLSNETYVDGATTYTYQLIKSQSGSKDPTYMQWIPNASNTTAAAVIIYYPYEGIDWSGEAVDAKWAARGAGAHPDDDAPYYDSATSSNITYTPMPKLNAFSNASHFTINGMHALVVYGRFYAGKSIDSDIQSVVDAYRFLESKSTVDKNKIGIYSGSWGGIGVLFGSKVATASYNLKPKVISLAYPVSDPKQLYSYIDSIPTLTANVAKQAEYSAFFDPYKRRINKATEALLGLPTRYDNYTHTQLVSNDASTFIIHDDWDTLVPVTATSNLVTAMTLADTYVYYQRHTTAIDFDTFLVNHSQTLQPIDFATALTWNYLFLVTELTDPANTRISLYSLSSFTAQFQHMVSMYYAGKNTTAFNKVLGLICKPNLFMNNVDTTNYIHSGSDIFFFMMDNYYQAGWAASGPDACAKLIASPPF